MASSRSTRTTTQIAEAAFVADDESPDSSEAPEAPEAPIALVAEAQEAPVIVSPLTKNAKVKGTWTMYFGAKRFDFVDGHRYDLPLDLFEYLKKSSNIYDTI